MHQFIAMLQCHTHEIYDRWKRRADELRKEIAEPHWTRFTFIYRRQAVCNTTERPRFAVFMNSAGNATPMPTERVYVVCESLDVSEREWLKDAVIG